MKERSLQVVLACLLVVGLFVLFTRKPKPLPRLADPMLTLSARGKVVAAGQRLSTKDAISLSIAVTEPSYVYLYKLTRGAPALEWGHPATEEAWSPGVYEPNFDDGKGVGFFRIPGPSALVVVTSPERMHQPDGLTAAELDAVTPPCARCGVARLDVDVIAPTESQTTQVGSADSQGY